MAEGQKARKIGSGMKPRGNQQVKPQKEAKTMTDQSTTEGQQVSTKEAVLKAQEGNETPCNLEPENGGELLQNLENSGSETSSILAQDDGLEAALEGSAEGELVDVGEIQVPQVDMETAMAVGTGTVKEFQTGYGKMKFTATPDEVWITKEGIKEILKAYGLGEQPDGSCGFVTKIQEGYVDAVRQWAESDGVPVEQWLSDRLYEYISTYGEPAKGR